MTVKPRKDLDRNSQLLLDYMISLKQKPVVMSVRSMNPHFKRLKEKTIPSMESKRAMMSRLEELGAIEWHRTGLNKYHPKIVILKKKIDG